MTPIFDLFDRTAALPKPLLARAALKKIRSTFENTNVKYERILRYGGWKPERTLDTLNGEIGRLEHERTTTELNIEREGS